ncbi:MAG: DUF4381 domain-containing protein [Pseudomonadota bacterium]
MSEEFDGLGLVELIDLLEPVPAPPPISMVPQTQGWIWLGLFALFLAFRMARRAQRNHAANAYRRAALKELVDVGDDPARISGILRRAALEAFPRADVAGLSGSNWLDFLDNSFPGSGFRSGPGEVLSVAPYRDSPEPVFGLNALAREWIRQHRAARAVQ